MGRKVTHALGLEGKVYGTVFVTCDEDEHHPEKLIEDSEIQWNTDSVEWLRVVDGDITDAWDEPDESDE